MAVIGEFDEIKNIVDIRANFLILCQQAEIGVNGCRLFVEVASADM